jgi:hypothetical protein
VTRESYQPMIYINESNFKSLVESKPEYFKEAFGTADAEKILKDLRENQPVDLSGEMIGVMLGYGVHNSKKFSEGPPSDEDFEAFEDQKREDQEPLPWDRSKDPDGPYRLICPPIYKNYPSEESRDLSNSYERVNRRLTEKMLQEHEHENIPADPAELLALKKQMGREVMGELFSPRRLEVDLAFRDASHSGPQKRTENQTTRLWPMGSPQMNGQDLMPAQQRGPLASLPGGGETYAGVVAEPVNALHLPLERILRVEGEETGHRSVLVRVGKEGEANHLMIVPEARLTNGMVDDIQQQLRNPPPNHPGFSVPAADQARKERLCNLAQREAIDRSDRSINPPAKVAARSVGRR